MDFRVYFCSKVFLLHKNDSLFNTISIEATEKIEENNKVAEQKISPAKTKGRFYHTFLLFKSRRQKKRKRERERLERALSRSFGFVVLNKAFSFSDPSTPTAVRSQEEREEEEKSRKISERRKKG